MKLKICLFFSVFLMFSESDASVVFSNWDTFFSAYYESAYLNRAETGAGLFVPRFGISDPEKGREIYLVSRIGVDSRTFLEKSDQIYNDNFMFLGLGMDELKWIPGFRFTLQLGNSIDLNPKINLGGWDGRAGWMSYHEKEWYRGSFRTEIYSEGFYVRRYRNGMGSLHLRNFWPMISRGQNRYEGLELGPALQFVISGDTRALDYNRFFETQYGARLQYHTPLSIALHVLGVKGFRTEKSSPIGNYNDLRVIITGGFDLN
jgi:hypothetical protein